MSLQAGDFGLIAPDFFLVGLDFILEVPNRLFVLGDPVIAILDLLLQISLGGFQIADLAVFLRKLLIFLGD